MIEIFYIFGIFLVWVFFTLFVAPLRDDPTIYHVVSYIPGAKIRFIIWCLVYLSMGYFMYLVSKGKENVGAIIWWLLGAFFITLFIVQYLAWYNYNIRLILVLLIVAIFLITFISTDYSFSSFDTSEDIFAINLLDVIKFWLMFLFGSLLALTYISERENYERKLKIFK